MAVFAFFGEADANFAGGTERAEHIEIKIPITRVVNLLGWKTDLRKHDVILANRFHDQLDRVDTGADWCTGIALGFDCYRIDSGLAEHMIIGAVGFPQLG